MRKESLEPRSPSSLFQYSVVLASLSALLISLDSSVNIAFPAITRAFALDVASIQWVVVGYVLTHASLLLGCGRLADIWGHQRLLTYGLVGSAIAFVGCGVAPTFAWFIAARVAQGVGAALVSGSAPALVTLAVPAEARGRALGFFQMSTGAGYAIGPLIGGFLVDGLGWRAVYLFRVLPALLLAWLAAVKLPSFQTRGEAQRFDLLGALTLAASVTGFLLAVSRSRSWGWTSWQVVALAIAAVFCFAAFLATERRARSPVIDLRLFRRRSFVIANLLGLLANCARFAIGLLFPYYVIEVLRYPGLMGGSLMLVAAMTTAIASPLSGRWSDRFGTAGLSAVGLLCEGVGLWMVSRLTADAGYLSVAFALGIVGLGLGVFEAPNMSFVMGAIPPTQQGVAGSINHMMRTLGILIAATGASTLFDSRREIYAARASLDEITSFHMFMPAFRDVFIAAAALCFVAFILSLLRGRENADSRA